MRILIVLAGVVLASCTRLHSPIPDGLYEANDETLIVTFERIAFNIHLYTPKSGGSGLALGSSLHSLNRQYQVFKDGTIIVCCGTSNDRMWLIRWFWDGENIVKTDSSGKVLATFKRR